MDSLDFRLQKLRQQGDTTLKPCSYISDEFIPIPPHKVGIAHLILKPRFLLADPVGCGKTAESLAAFGFLKERDRKLKLLVMAEKSAIFQWNSSVTKFLVGIQPTIVGYDFDSGSIGSRFDRYRTYESTDPDVYVLSYHQMTRDIDVILHNIDNYVVIFDEVQYLKSNQSTALYPAALKLSMKGRYVWGLSATPHMNGRLEELYSIFEVIRPGTFGSFERFKSMYCNYERRTARTPRGLRHYYTLNEKTPYKNVHEFVKVIKPFFLKRPAEQFDAHLPKIVTKDSLLTLLPAQRMLYNQIVDKKFPSLDGVKRLNPLTSLTYAQLASDGPVTLGRSDDSSKMVEILRILKEEVNEEKVIVYATFRRTIDYICDNLKQNNINHVRITGKEHKSSQRNEAKLVFNDLSSGTNVICINKAGGSSLDLQQASIVIFYNLPWSWGVWTQVLGRARRIGSPHSRVLAILLINQGTIDQYAFQILQKKEDLVDQTFGVDDSALNISNERLIELYNMIREKKAA